MITTDFTRSMMLILIALTKGERHGYGIMKEIGNMTNDDYWVSPGTLYRSIDQMVEDRLIEEVTEMPNEDNKRRRKYRITDQGRYEVQSELMRMEKLLEVARSRGLLQQ